MQSLKSEAAVYIKNSKQKSPFSKRSSVNVFDSSSQCGADKSSVVIRVDKKEDISYEQYEKDGKKYLSIFHIFNPTRSSYLKIERDISGTDKLLG